MLDKAVQTDLLHWYVQHLNLEKLDTLNIDTQINDLFKLKPKAFKFTLGGTNNPKGDDTCQSPIWVRPQSLMKDKLGDFKQVVGHTMQTQLV